MTAQQNTRWQVRVRELLKDGYGTEDIAVITGAHVDHVRAEVAILRETGVLATMLHPTRWGPTALRLMTAAGVGKG